MSYSDKAALRGEPGYVWRSGQERRLGMIREWSDLRGTLLDNGCGLGTYLEAFGRASPGATLVGLELEHDRAVRALTTAHLIIEGVGEHLPFPDACFDLVFSNEVIEHVTDDRQYAAEMARVTKAGGRIIVFCPNRWYPVEQHGVYWRGEYRFGNVPLVNYLPDALRDRLAPHVRTYTPAKLRAVFAGLPLKELHHGRIFGGYDNLSRRYPRAGTAVRQALYGAEKTPLAALGLSHLLVLERT